MGCLTLVSAPRHPGGWLAVLEEREIPELLRFRDLDARIRSVGINWTRQDSGVGEAGQGLGGQRVTEEGCQAVWEALCPAWLGGQGPSLAVAGGKAGPRARGVRCKRGQQTV